MTRWSAVVEPEEEGGFCFLCTNVVAASAGDHEGMQREPRWDVHTEQLGGDCPFPFPRTDSPTRRLYSPHSSFEGRLCLGTPCLQMHTVVFDTGSPYLWLLRGQPTETTSATFRWIEPEETVRISYLSQQSVGGELAEDTVRLPVLGGFNTGSAARHHDSSGGGGGRPHHDAVRGEETLVVPHVEFLSVDTFDLDPFGGGGNKGNKDEPGVNPKMLRGIVGLAPGADLLKKLWLENGVEGFVVRFVGSQDGGVQELAYGTTVPKAWYYPHFDLFKTVRSSSLQE